MVTSNLQCYLTIWCPSDPGFIPIFIYWKLKKIVIKSLRKSKDLGDENELILNLKKFFLISFPKCFYIKIWTSMAILLKKMTIFSFWQFFDIQLAIFRRVKLRYNLISASTRRLHYVIILKNAINRQNSLE